MIHIYDGNNYVRRILETGSWSYRTMFERMHDGDKHIWVWDGKNSLAARRALYPEYKRQRRTLGEDIISTLDMTKEILSLTPAVQIEIEGYEADDIIAWMIETSTVDKELMHLHSNDGDLCRLGVKMDRDPLKIPNDMVVTYKATVGDPSDNIPGIPGFGKGSWEKCNQQVLREVLEKNFVFIQGMSVEEIASELNVPKRVANVLSDPNIQQQIITYRKVVEFVDIPPLEAKHQTIGVSNRAKAQEIFEKYMVI